MRSLGRSLGRSWTARTLRLPGLAPPGGPAPLVQAPARGLRKNVRTVKIILLEDHPKLGYQGEVVSVRPGYGRNFLVPQKLAVYATPENREEFATNKEAADGEATENGRDREFKKFLNEYTSRLRKAKLNFVKSVTEDNQVKYPVTKADILIKLWNDGEFLGLTEDSLVLPQSPLPLGEHQLKINLTKGWVAPGIGIFAEFERLAGEEEVLIPLTIVPVPLALTEEQKHDRREQKAAVRKQKEEVKKLKEQKAKMNK